MPEHSSWFVFIPGYHNLLAALSKYSWFRASWIDGVNIQETGIQHVIGALVIVLLLLIFGIYIKRKLIDIKLAVIPENKLTLKTVIELITEILFNQMKDIMGEKAAIYFFPLIGTSAFFILFSNFMGLIPGFMPPTGNLNTTIACAIVIFCTTHIFGIKEHGFSYIKHFLGPIIKWYALPLMLLMFVIEVVSHFARIISLSVRLLGNMFADHMVVGVITFLCPLVVPVPIMILGVLVCIVQTVIFCILSTIYISLAIEHEHD